MRAATATKGRKHMSTTLHEFVSKALEANRIRFGDLRRLQRDILPYRIATRHEAEMLLALDAKVERADRDWVEYLVPAVAQFVVWGLEPAGRIDQEKAEWLIDALARARPKIASAVIRPGACAVCPSRLAAARLGVVAPTRSI